MALVPDYNIGDFEVEVDDDALIAICRNVVTGKVIARFRGESAWSNARRKAEDLYWAGRNA
jgi:hypothetical protein